jgi:hypothetical protein
MLVKLPSGQEWDSPYVTWHGCRKVWKSGSASIIMWAYSAPLGSDRVNWSAKICVTTKLLYYKSVEDPNILVPSVLVSFCSTILQHPLRWLSETVPYCVWWKMRLWDVKDGIKRGGSGWAARLRRWDGGGAALVAEGLLPQQPQYRYTTYT